MKNKIASGNFSGKKIRSKGEHVFIRIRGGRLYFTTEVVDHIKLISVIQQKSFLSGWLRGLFSKCLGISAWLSAMQSAKAKYLYTVQIVYRDGSVSVSLIDSKKLEKLAAVNRI